MTFRGYAEEKSAENDLLGSNTGSDVDTTAREDVGRSLVVSPVLGIMASRIKNVSVRRV